MTKSISRIFPVIFSLFFSYSVLADAELPSPINSNLPSPATSTESLNSVAAVVNSEIITQNELEQAIAQAKQQLGATGNPNAISDIKLRKMVLDQLIDEKLMLELAKRANVSVTDAQVTQAIQHIAAKNNLSVADLKNKLQQEKMSFSAYRKMIHKQLLVHQVQQSAVGTQITVTAADVEKARAVYQSQVSDQQQFHVIDILADSKQQAEQFATELHTGKDLSQVAPKQTSDLGWQTANTLPAIFMQQLQNMQPGDIAGPIQAPNGYHVIKLIDVRGQSAALTKAQLQNIAYQMKFQQAVKKWIKTIRETAYIKIN
ncbi:MAG: hypothetical protein A3C44_08140 [Gammaproteobacteria bacterium RIFCSPHIGHO2_02_FULL_39_13]|nr:MAG: hypothetical protein A3C44_08140 [Gammaproteobacteria bacterium RIFCSPHIGHO2_02_FULL_39_13]OGT50577.1 MAG: hypothetical protein A3E53_03555 [Gammaproteobacteria bacterium RIFCSPHIGHO2_12_FULL_39_24]